MTRVTPNTAVTALALTLIAGLCASQAAAQVSLATLNTPYTQSFDSLSNSGTANTWSDNATLPGWYAAAQSVTISTYRADTGGSNTGAIYSYGSAASTDRALGSVSSGTPGTLYYGVRLVNNTGSWLTTLAVAFTGEQWRCGGNTASQTLAFKYQLAASDLKSGVWTAFSALDFASPIHTATAGALDGNAAANRQALSANLNVNVAPGQEIWLRWEDINDTGNDHGFGIDDLSITPQSLSTSPSGSGLAGPATVAANDDTKLTVTVTPGANPASTGLAVVCDATPIGGSASQSLVDDGTSGDVTPGDNVFSLSTTVAGGTPAGAKSLACTVGDAQSRSGSAAITLNVVALTKIHDVQGSGHASPLLGQSVSVRGVVTALLAGSFYIEEPDAGWDADPATSEAISVYTAPSGLNRGDLVTVTGTVQEYGAAGEPLQPTTTEISPVANVSRVSSGNPLPTPVVIAAADVDPAGGFWQLERYEAMRATFSPSLTVVGPTGGTIDEVNATSTSSGWFWGAVTGGARPFREQGANTLDANVFNTPPGACTGACDPAQVPRFDGNPERFDVGTKSQTGGSALDVRAGDVVAGLTGIVCFTTSAGYRSWQFFPDPGTGTVSLPGPDAAPVPAASSREFTVATFNMQRFFDTAADGEPGGAPTLTATAFANRLNKASLAIRNYLLMPDVLAVEEVENLATLTAIANKVNADAGGASPQYVPRLVEGNDIGGIDVGFLIKTAEVAAGIPRVAVGSVVQENLGELFANPDSSTELLNDRPPLRLMATVNHANGASFPLTVIVVHQKALSSVDSQSAGSNSWPTVGARNRAKRQAQARSLAALVNARQAADHAERIVVLGDVNAFEFNDGYTDVMNITTGQTPQTTDAQAILGNGGTIYTTPPLTDLISTDPAQRYSYSDYGSVQNLDHLMVNGVLQADTAARRLEHARTDADFPDTDRNDPNTARRLSDHDPLVGYFEVAKFSTADLSAAISGAPAQAPPGGGISYTITVTNGGPDAAPGVALADALPAGTSFQSLSAPGGWSCATPAVGANGAVNCTTASLGVTGAAFTLTLGVDAGVPLGATLQHAASVTQAGTDPNPGNDADSATTVAAAGAAATIAAVAGAGQHARLGTAFAQPLQAIVRDALGNPASGVDVTFTAPGSGAGGCFPGMSLTAVVATGADGIATSPAFVANSVLGGYSVTATAGGVAGFAPFALTNDAQEPIPTLGGPGIAFLILLLAGAGVALLARAKC